MKKIPVGNTETPGARFTASTIENNEQIFRFFVPEGTVRTTVRKTLMSVYNAVRNNRISDLKKTQTIRQGRRNTAIDSMLGFHSVQRVGRNISAAVFRKHTEQFIKGEDIGINLANLSD